MNLKDFFESKGYSIKEKENYDGYIEKWDSWYKGKVKKFHSYYIYNRPGHKVRRERRSLQMAKKVCEDWADLLFDEKVRINLSDETDNKTLQDLIQKLKLMVLVNRGVERSFALGTGALVLSVQKIKTDGSVLDVSKAKVFAEFVEAQKIYPLSWTNEEITECAFVTYKVEQGKKYAYISMHILNEQSNYVIKNYKFKLNDKQLEVVEDETILEEFDTKNDIPWFSIIKPNICNNIDSETPFGISVFANSIHTLMNIDNIYDTKDLEVTLGRRRTFVSEELLTYSDGKGTEVFAPDDISVYVLPKGFNKDMMIQSDNDDLRTDKMISDLDSELNVLSSKVGFGNERYKFDKGDIQTATGVISANSDMFRTIKKHELVLEDTIVNFILALIYACKTFTSISFNKEPEIKIDFDDSIIEDKGAEQIRAQTEVGQGLRSKKDYMENIRGLSDEQIHTELQQIIDEKQSNQEAFGFNEE